MIQENDKKNDDRNKKIKKHKLFFLGRKLECNFRYEYISKAIL